MRLRRLLATLKFRIVALMAGAAVLSALAAALVVMHVTEAELRQQLLAHEGHEAERMAGMYGSKLETLKRGLKLLASHARAEHWQSSERMEGLLGEMAPMRALFDSLVAATPDGRMLANLVDGQLSPLRMNLNERDYFRQVLQSDQPVVSPPLMGAISGQPILVIAVPALSPEGVTVGVMIGSIKLQTNGLFTLADAARARVVRELVIDRQGIVVAHMDAARVLSQSSQEPGLAPALARWQAQGSPIDTSPAVAVDGMHLVSLSGIPASDWVLVRITPAAVALAPLEQARNMAWLVALLAGSAAAAVAGLIGYLVVRPIEMMRHRAERMLEGRNDDSQVWPDQQGEIGAMSKAFQLLLEARDRQREYSQGLLIRVQAVLDNAEIGIALTRNGVFELVSRQLCATFELSADAFIGKPTQSIYADASAYEAFSQRARPSFMAHGTFDGEVELVRANGRPFWARIRGRAVAPGDRSQGTIWVISDVTNDVQQREALNHAAYHDSLTGLYNRVAFEAQLGAGTARAGAEPFSALFIDLDRFKLVNDTAGHAAGDAMLRGVAAQMQACLRTGDSLARLGGDEFAVLLRNCPVSGATRVAEKIRAVVEAFVLDWEGSRHSVGASIGVVFVSEAGLSMADVLRHADQACYRAKRGGRNQVVVGETLTASHAAHTAQADHVDHADDDKPSASAADVPLIARAPGVGELVAEPA